MEFFLEINPPTVTAQEHKVRVVNPFCQIVLEHRYLCYHSWEEIAVELNMNIRSVYRLHSEALQEVDRILQHEKI